MGLRLYSLTLRLSGAAMLWGAGTLFFGWGWGRHVEIFLHQRCSGPGMHRPGTSGCHSESTSFIIVSQHHLSRRTTFPRLSQLLSNQTSSPSFLLPHPHAFLSSCVYVCAYTHVCAPKWVCRGQKTALEIPLELELEAAV